MGRKANHKASAAKPKAVAVSAKRQEAAAWYERGLQMHGLGQLEQALAAYQQAVQIDRRFGEAYNNLGNVLKDQGNWKDAFSAYKKALRVLPDHPMILSNIGHALLNDGQRALAVHFLEKAIKADPAFADAYVNLGNALRHSEPQRAIKAFRKALHINPQLPEAYNNLAALLEELGQNDEAAKALGDAIRLRPDFGEAHRHLANLERHTGVTGHVRQMAGLFDDPGTRDHDRVQLGFGLGKAYEEIGDHAEAMRYWKEANRLHRQGLAFSLQQQREYFQVIEEAFDATRLAGEGSGIADQTPIFILGMPRSGTSLVEQILASHPQVFGAGELEYLSKELDARCAALSAGGSGDCLSRLQPKDLRHIGSAYLKQLRTHDRQARFVTDKLPHNFLHIGLIRLALPGARIIHCVRDPVDTCLSIYKNYFTGHHPYAYDQSELGGYYRLYQRLMAHWRSVSGDAIHEVCYEQLIADQASQTRALLAYCDLPWDVHCLSFEKNRRRVATSSSAQVRRPIYADSVELWKRYQADLEDLLTALRSQT